MIAIRKKLRAILLIMALISGPILAEPEAQQHLGISRTGEVAGGIVVTVEVATLSYRTGDPISLIVKLKNVSKREIRFRIGSIYSFYNIMVKGKDGTEVPKTSFGKKLEWGAAFSKSFLRLAPGQEHSTSLPINEIFEMTTEGTYTIDVRKAFTIRDGKNVLVSAPTLTISVIGVTQ